MFDKEEAARMECVFCRYKPLEVLFEGVHVIARFEDEPFAGKGIRHWLKKAENSRKKL